MSHAQHHAKRLTRTTFIGAVTASLVATVLVSANPARAEQTTPNNELPATEPVSSTAVEFVEAPIDETYVQSGTVSEQTGDAQQVEAITPDAGVSAQQAAQDTQSIARIDLDADTAVLGVTWQKDSVSPESVFWRNLAAGSWSAWQQLDIAETPEQATKAGTEPLTVTNSDAAEIVAYTGSGETVPGLEIQVVDSTQFAEPENALEAVSAEVKQMEEAPAPEEPAEPTEPIQDEVIGEEPVASTATYFDKSPRFDTAMVTSNTRATTTKAAASTSYNTGFHSLSIKTRAAWCGEALCTNPTWRPQTMKTVSGAIVHHTAGTNSYTQAQVPQVLRSTWAYQAKTLGWGDIGYNIIVDKYGGVWEGRFGGLTKAIIGGHARGSNESTIGFTVLGTYSASAPPAAAQNSLAKALGWKLKLHGITNVTGSMTTTHGNGYKVTVPRISGHRQVNATTCPGDAFFARVPAIRSTAQSLINSSSGPAKFSGSPVQFGQGWSAKATFPGNWNGDSYSDLMLVATNGDLFFYPGVGADKLGAARKIGTGWQSFDWIQGGIDWTGDGKNDLLARNKRSGALMVYPGDGKGGFGRPFQIGQGWGGMRHIALIQLGSRPAIYAINADTRLHAYIGNNRGGFSSIQAQGKGWGNMTLISGTGDWTNDGVGDLIARHKDGTLYRYAGSTSGLLGTAVKMGTGWNDRIKMGSANLRSAKSPLWFITRDGKLFSQRVQ